ncbi:hypothetical protein AMAG_02227 [Allomyces macrogynus ATCC 38327]|uniref:Uncharacterized protein n=1 Tax=Allomyces macrogynus (strain ATCC 38327) TaxID=578462 RepID=A0A0L0S1K3_ALLM3|nr:hypothetical protein AMAG_02227 [Allomyces macrogynus ATCC 38327]|eukprot:KNE56418.1 hypothetical protein AMAG_02227 [Allomyces macrogynus ATCC 38327]
MTMLGIAITLFARILPTVHADNAPESVPPSYFSPGASRPAMLATPFSIDPTASPSAAARVEMPDVPHAAPTSPPADAFGRVEPAIRAAGDTEAHRIGADARRVRGIPEPATWRDRFVETLPVLAALHLMRPVPSVVTSPNVHASPDAVNEAKTRSTLAVARWVGDADRGRVPRVSSRAAQIVRAEHLPFGTVLVRVADGAKVLSGSIATGPAPSAGIAPVKFWEGDTPALDDAMGKWRRQYKLAAVGAVGLSVLSVLNALAVDQPDVVDKATHGLLR